MIGSWTQEEIELVKKYRPECTLPELQEILKSKGFIRSQIAIKRKAHKLGIFYAGPGITDMLLGEITIGEYRKERLAINRKKIDDQSIKEFSKIWDKIQDIKHEYVDPNIINSSVGFTERTNLKKYVCISDLHIPFEIDELVRHVVELHHADAEALIVNGDFLDLHAVSTWPKEKAIPLKKEYDTGLEYLKYFSKKFKNVYLTRGNHEFRLNRHFHCNLCPEVSFLVNKEILKRMVNGEIYDLYGDVVDRIDLPNVHFAGGQEAWFIKIGKTVFVHPLKYKSGAMETAIAAQEYFADRDSDIDCVVVGHTHKFGKVVYNGTLCIEDGCLTSPMEYTKQGTLNFKSQILGYSVIYQDEQGNCDFTLSRPIFLGIQKPKITTI